MELSYMSKMMFLNAEIVFLIHLSIHILALQASKTKQIVM